MGGHGARKTSKLNYLVGSFNVICNMAKNVLTTGDKVLVHVVLCIHAERHTRGGRGPALHLRATSA